MTDYSKKPKGWKAPCAGCKYSRVVSIHQAECDYFAVRGWPEMGFIHGLKLNKDTPSLTTGKAVNGPHAADAKIYECVLRETS